MKCHCARNVESQFPAPSSEHWYRKQAGYKTNIYTAIALKLASLFEFTVHVKATNSLHTLLMQPHCSSNDPSTPILETRETSMTGTEPDTELMDVETGIWNLNTTMYTLITVFGWRKEVFVSFQSIAIQFELNSLSYTWFLALKNIHNLN